MLSQHPIIAYILGVLAKVLILILGGFVIVVLLFIICILAYTALYARKPPPPPPPIPTSEGRLYPGYNIDLRHYWSRGGRLYAMGADVRCLGAPSDLLPVKEVAMMRLMDTLTDKSGWERKVFDEEIVGRWRKEALAQGEIAFTGEVDEEGAPRLVDAKAFDYCIEELRVKAKYFASTGLIPTLDSERNTVVKSDTLVPPALKAHIRSAFAQLLTDTADAPDWHPRSGGRVRNLVHPSLYPFIWGRSNFIPEEVVGVADAVEKWAGKGETAPEPKTQFQDGLPEGYYKNSGVPDDCWSEKYQWLPANIAFQDDGSVRFTSYVNNLHPERYPEIYRTLEKLVEVAIPAWEQCLVEYYDNGTTLASCHDWHWLESQLPEGCRPPGRTESRFKLLHDCNDDNYENWQQFRDGIYTEAEIHDLEEEEKWDRIRKPVLPDPVGDPALLDYSVDPSNRLRAKFAATGLQVIVKMASIELSAASPDFGAGSWHVEGQMNERIVATALYYLDSENVTDSSLSFRMHPPYDGEKYQALVSQGNFGWLEALFGQEFGDSRDELVQLYGHVATPEGRLLAFPNCFQHQVSGFRLKEGASSGHRRFVALWLVDPHTRIVSTANVPPQRADWWQEAVFADLAVAGEGRQADMTPAELTKIQKEQGLDHAVAAGGVRSRRRPAQRGAQELEIKDTQHSTGMENTKARADSPDSAADSKGAAQLPFPSEILRMVREQGEMGGGLMTREEAAMERLKLMDERSRLAGVYEREMYDLRSTYYSCEH